MLPGDSRGRWDRGVFRDERVVQFWDQDFAVGMWFGEHLDDMGVGAETGGVYWDAYLVFDKGARWDDTPSPVVDAGSTVIRKSEQLQTALTPLL
jgi:hypothetical protein